MTSRPWLTSGSVELVVAAPADAVYAVVADVTRIGERSPECHSAVWLPGAAAGEVGSVFVGSNRAQWATSWSRRCEVLVADPGRAFAFRTMPTALIPDSTTWRYDLEPADGGTRVTHSYTITKPLPRPLKAFTGALLPQHRDMRPQMQANLAVLRAQFAVTPA
ncbi:SRPBCC family protein [Blastococcus sp. URHD0036]|uniref:SRPBCC family protein n=1 Tax=Blastococcus sp. URHD0036 TaxID=1380356 RepID=UPI000497C376|nr:SRPBCC family protein [Blastococcus sp. URHD0036]